MHTLSVISGFLEEPTWQHCVCILPSTNSQGVTQGACAQECEPLHVQAPPLSVKTIFNIADGHRSAYMNITKN